MRREVNTTAAMACEIPHSAVASDRAQRGTLSSHCSVTQPPRLPLPMALYDIPGWPVPDDLVAVAPENVNGHPSTTRTKKNQSAMVNVEKVMEQLSACLGLAAENPRRDPTEGKNGPAIQQVEPHKTSKKRKKGQRKVHQQEIKSQGRGPLSRSTLTSLQHDMNLKQSLARTACPSGV